MIDFYRFSHLSACPTLAHAVSTKSKTFPYHFSLALHTNEEKQSIIQNRTLLANAFDTSHDLDFVLAHQTHSDHIHIVKQKRSLGWEDLDDAIQDCDALITDIPHIALCILTADCVPILLYDTKKKVIAAIHAGWKGTQSEIAYKTVRKMQQHYGSNPKDILAGIAPSIGKCCYEVDQNVAQHFFHIPKSSTPIGDKYMLDLPYINQTQLLRAGVQKRHIKMSHICTACEVEQFFSYRKEHGCSGRFMSIISLLPKP